MKDFRNSNLKWWDQFMVGGRFEENSRGQYLSQTWYSMVEDNDIFIYTHTFLRNVLHEVPYKKFNQSNLACCVVAASHLASTPGGHGRSNLLARAPHCLLRSLCGRSDAECKAFTAACWSSLKTLILLVRGVMPSDKLTLERLLAKPGFDGVGVPEALLFGLS